jgi:hypothetical protein
MPVTIDEYWLTFAVSVALPILVALVTKRLASGAVKSLVLLFLSVITGWLTSLYATDGAFELKAAAVGVAVSFITAVGAHFGLLGSNALNITGKNGAIQTAVPGGLGSAVQDAGRFR